MSFRYFLLKRLSSSIEVFCFSYDKNWENYEHIQADIFDHLLAAVSYFDLEIFETPSGKDLELLKNLKD